MERLNTISAIGGLDATRLRALSMNEPAFFYERARLAGRVSELRKALPGATRIAYSLKANPFPALVQTMLGQLDGADVTSYSEMITALNAGARPETIMFAGPAKKPEDLAAAVAMGVGICVESATELARLTEVARDLSRTARVLLRINPDFALSGASMRMGGAPTQFGIDVSALPAIWDALRNPALRFVGVHIYWGSQCLSEAAVEEAQRTSVDLVERLAPHFPAPPEIFNLGGGFGIPYFEKDSPLNLALVGANFAPLHDRLAARFPSAQVYLELGRYLVGEAGTYLTNVVDVKVSHGVSFVVTDGGMHQFLAASGNLGQKIRRNYPLSLIPVGRPAGGDGSDEMIVHEIVGALCTPIDLLAHRLPGPEVRVGDMIAIHCAGAYGRSASPLDFLSHPHPHEFLI